MAKSNKNQDSGHRREGVWFRISVLLGAVLFLLPNLQGGQPSFPRGGGVPGNPLVENNETWKDLGDALAMPSASFGDLRILPNIDPGGQYNVRLVHAIQEPVENIDADNAAAAAEFEADLAMWLAVAEVASLPRQIERDEANMMATRPQVLSSVAESGVSPSSLVDDVAAGAPQHLPPQSPVPEAVAADAPAPEVVGILAGVLPQRIEDEEKAHAEAQVEVEVAMEDFPPGMLELISDVARLPQFAAASMTVPAGGLESNLEERMRVDQPEAGDSSADFQAEGHMQEEDVENLEVKEPHARAMQ